MEHKVIDQTLRIHDIISFQSDFKVHSPTVTDLDFDGEHCVLSYQWLRVKEVSGTEELIATWRNGTWVGVKAA